MSADDAKDRLANSDAVVQVALEEFRALRAEITQRLAIQATIATLAPVIVGIAVAADFEGDRALLVLTASTVSLLFALLYLAHDVTISMAGDYISKELSGLLERAAGHVGPPELLYWEKSRITKLYGKGWGNFTIRAASAVGSVVLVTPAIASLGYYSFQMLTDGQHGDLDPIPRTMIFVGWALVVIFVFVSYQLVKRYGEIGSTRGKG